MSITPYSMPALHGGLGPSWSNVESHVSDRNFKTCQLLEWLGPYINSSTNPCEAISWGLGFGCCKYKEIKLKRPTVGGTRRDWETYMRQGRLENDSKIELRMSQLHCLSYLVLSVQYCHLSYYEAYDHQCNHKTFDISML